MKKYNLELTWNEIKLIMECMENSKHEAIDKYSNTGIDKEWRKTWFNLYDNILDTREDIYNQLEPQFINRSNKNENNNNRP